MRSGRIIIIKWSLTFTQRWMPVTIRVWPEIVLAKQLTQWQTKYLDLIVIIKYFWNIYLHNKTFFWKLDTAVLEYTCSCCFLFFILFCSDHDTLDHSATSAIYYKNSFNSQNLPLCCKSNLQNGSGKRPQNDYQFHT